MRIRPRIRDRLRLAWHALFSRGRRLRYYVEQYSDAVRWPLDLAAMKDEFYRACSDEDFDRARELIRVIDDTVGRDDGDVVQMYWALDAEDI